jgi:hypothetical protein
MWLNDDSSVEIVIFKYLLHSINHVMAFEDLFLLKMTQFFVVGVRVYNVY